MKTAAAGFTLLELLVAMTLLALLSAALAAGLDYSLRAWRGAREGSDQVSTLRAVHDGIGRLLSRARPAYANADPADPAIDFAGTGDAVVVIAPLPDAIEPGIMARQRLGLIATRSGLALALSWRLDLPGAGQATTAVLLEGVRSLRLRYWGSPGPGLPAAWQDRWLGQPRLPGLIAVDIRREAAAGLSFVVSPGITHVAACRYRPIGPVCER